jgi:hypothetical protein
MVFQFRHCPDTKTRCSQYRWLQKISRVLLITGPVVKKLPTPEKQIAMPKGILRPAKMPKLRNVSSRWSWYGLNGITHVEKLVAPRLAKENARKGNV